MRRLPPCHAAPRSHAYSHASEAHPPPKLSLLFWVSSASGLARAVTLSTHVPHTKLRRAVSIAQPRLCLGRGGALPRERGSQYLECNAQNRMEAWRTLPRAGDTHFLSSWAGQRRAAQGSGCKLKSFEDCGKAVLLIVGLLGPHRSQASALFKEKCRRNRKLQGRADRGSLASKLRAI